jgi:hypothetical protein
MRIGRLTSEITIFDLYGFTTSYSKLSSKLRVQYVSMLLNSSGREFESSTARKNIFEHGLRHSMLLSAYHLVIRTSRIDAIHLRSRYPSAMFEVSSTTSRP